MRKTMITALMALLLWPLTPVTSFGAYHHQGEQDAPKFLTVYLDKAGTKLDNCALCHSGGTIPGDKPQVVGSCQWCHYSYGYDGSGPGGILSTLNPYGSAYHDNGRNTDALKTIELLDSDGDGYSNIVEIQANRYPGDANDDPTKVLAPARVYTKAQLAALPQHTQFLLMNTTRQIDFYALYTGVPLKVLLDDAGILLSSATSIQVFAPDGFACTHPINPTPGMYHVYGDMAEGHQYPTAKFYYDIQADIATDSEIGWCDYSAPSCAGRNNLDDIAVEGGLMAILALKREGLAMVPGVLNTENKLDGEGPFRVVVPQTVPAEPDQSVNSTHQEVIWPYVKSKDHNTGACSRSATIIKVLPLPEGTTDINTYEAGWSYVDQEKIVIYGDIQGDSNGNGVMDSEEGTDPAADFDSDGTPDYQDSDTANPRSAKGLDHILIHTSQGDLAIVACLAEDDPLIPQTDKPDGSMPYGTTRFTITGLDKGASVTLTLRFPAPVPTSARYYKITESGWQRIPFGSNDGDAIITLSLTDGDKTLDGDGLADGKIVDPGALVIPDTTINPRHGR